MKIKFNNCVSKNIQVDICVKIIPEETKFSVDGSNESVEDQVVKWILRCLEHDSFDLFYNKVGGYDWNVVHTLLDPRKSISWSGSESDPDCYEYDSDHQNPNLSVLYQKMTFAIRLCQNVNSILCNCELKRKSPEQKLDLTQYNTCCVDPRILKNVMKQTKPPNCVHKVSIFGICGESMQSLWHLIVTDDETVNISSIPGEGHTIHPMWIRLKNGKWKTIGETSHKFDWI